MFSLKVDAGCMSDWWRNCSAEADKEGYEYERCD